MLSISQFYCRGLIYQALLPCNSPIGFDESNPYYQIYIHFFFASLRAYYRIVNAFAAKLTITFLPGGDKEPFHLYYSDDAPDTPQSY
jgi:hypothetical protein